MPAELWIAIAGAYLVMSLITLIMFWRDKRAARKGNWRTPEKTLLLLALLGGWPGAMLGMKLFRHKTKTPKFTVGVPAIAVLHGIALGAAVWLLVIR